MLLPLRAAPGRTGLAVAVATCFACSHPPPTHGDAIDAARDATRDARDSSNADGADAQPDIFIAHDRILLSATTQVPRGEERYQCEVFRWQRDGGIAIGAISPQMGPGVHHANVYWESGPDGPVDPVTGCPADRAWHPLYTSGIGTQDLRFPPETAFPMADGVRFVLEVHYVNTTAAPLDTGASITLELRPDDEPFIPIGVMGIGDTSVVLPPHQQTTLRGDCSDHETLENVFHAFPHMHRLGTSIHTVVDGVPLVGVDRWTTTDQPFVPIDPPVTIASDQVISTTCVYNNTTDGTVWLGGLSTDEMCFVTLYYWPATRDNGTYCQDPVDAGAPDAASDSGI